VRRSAAATLTALLFALPSRGSDDSAYIAALRDHGYSDLAVEFLERRLADGKLTADEKADVEFEVASLHADASRNIADLIQREQALAAAADRFAEFAKKHPNHRRQGEALAETAAVALQKGRLRILQAQLPSYQAMSAKFADEGRASLSTAAGLFDKAAKQMSDQRDKLPLPLEDEKKNAPIRRARARLFNKIAEARFQHAYAIFLAAESHRSLPLPSGEPDAAANAEEAYQKGIKSAEAVFTAVADDYRQWLIGPVARVWQARCMAARGDHRRARGLYDEVFAAKDKRLDQVRRQAFFFQLLSLAQQNDLATVIARGEAWLRDNPRFRNTAEGFGVQLELARACAKSAESSDAESRKLDFLKRANGYYETVGKSANEFQGLARREQLKIEPLLAKDVPLREFQQFFSRAQARLDAVPTDASAEDKKQTLDKVKELLQQALDVAKEKDPVHQAKLLLAFTQFQTDDYAGAAKTAEAELRANPKSASAAQLFTIALAAQGMVFEKANQGGNGSSEAKALEELAKFGIEKFEGVQADEARLTLGRLEAHPTRKKYAEAAELFKAVAPASPRYPEARSELGRLYVEWSRSAAKPDADTKSKRTEALGFMQEASSALQKTRRGQLDRLMFATEGLLAELLLEKGDAQEAWSRIEPLVGAVERKSLPPSVDPPLRLTASLTALQAAIQLGKFDATDRLIEVVSKQQGQEQAGDVTQVFLLLASRMRDQLEKQIASGDVAAGQKMEESYIAFLDRLAERKTGQTLQSLAFLGTAYVEIRRFDKAEALIAKAVEEAKTAPASEKGAVLRVKVADALCKSGLGKHEDAVNLIDALAETEGNFQEIVFAKGKILVAAGRVKEAERHWEKLVVGMIRQRPPLFYEAFHQLIETLLLQSGDDRKAALLKAGKLLHAVLDRPHATMTPALRERLERQLKRVESE
jgi:outer membrane protein assembly factor BamD (BamD/ComL family)